MVEINSLVPDFSLMGSDDKEHKLSQYKGKKVILLTLLIKMQLLSV